MTDNKKGKGALALGALAAAAAAGAVGYYFYASTDAKKHRRIAAKWATDLKKDVVREAKKLKDLDKAALATVVDEATAAYRGVRKIDAKDLVRAAKELKSNWKELASEVRGSPRGKGAKKRPTKGASKKRTA